MRDQHKEIVVPFRAVLFIIAASLAAVVPLRTIKAAGDSPTVAEGIGIGGSVTNSTINNTVNQENPATLAMLAKAISAKDISEEHRRQAEAKAAELAAKLGFTSAAVAEFFKILGEQNVPEKKFRRDWSRSPPISLRRVTSWRPSNRTIRTWPNEPAGQSRRSMQAS
jgi:hypothetical protein